MPREDYTHRMTPNGPVPLTEAEKDEAFAREQAWNAEAATRAINEMRVERDRRLTATDPVLLEDHPNNANKVAWKTYRQALRDLPGNTADPVAFMAAWTAYQLDPGTNPDPWPTPPS